MQAKVTMTLKVYNVALYIRSSANTLNTSLAWTRQWCPSTVNDVLSFNSINSIQSYATCAFLSAMYSALTLSCHDTPCTSKWKDQKRLVVRTTWITLSLTAKWTKTEWKVACTALSVLRRLAESQLESLDWRPPSILFLKVREGAGTPCHRV